jgi:hypothetical protein
LIVTIKEIESIPVGSVNTDLSLYSSGSGRLEVDINGAVAAREIIITNLGPVAAGNHYVTFTAATDTLKTLGSDFGKVVFS